MSISCKAFILLGLLVSSLTGYAQAVNVNSVHYWTAPKRARMMIDVSSRPDHSVKLLDQPPRLVIDIHDAKLARALNQPPSSHALFSKVRTVQKDNDVRIVVN
ncbi:MAG: AMIN domain-containing protein, partial [Methylosarcina sp.]